MTSARESSAPATSSTSCHPAMCRDEPAVFLQLDRVARRGSAPAQGQWAQEEAIAAACVEDAAALRQSRVCVCCRVERTQSSKRKAIE